MQNELFWLQIVYVLKVPALEFRFNAPNKAVIPVPFFWNVCKWYLTISMANRTIALILSLLLIQHQWPSVHSTPACFQLRAAIVIFATVVFSAGIFNSYTKALKGQRITQFDITIYLWLFKKKTKNMSIQGFRTYTIVWVLTSLHNLLIGRTEAILYRTI